MDAFAHLLAAISRGSLCCVGCKIEPDSGGAASHADDRGDNLLRRVANYEYDALNRSTAVVYPQETALNVTYRYDSAQSVCSAGRAFLTGHLREEFGDVAVKGSAKQQSVQQAIVLVRSYLK
jgi:hypothetical protein